MADDDIQSFLEAVYGTKPYHDPALDIGTRSTAWPSLPPLPDRRPSIGPPNWRPESATAPVERGVAETLYGIARTPYDVGHAGAEGVLNSYYGKAGSAALNAVELGAMLGIPSAKVTLGPRTAPPSSLLKGLMVHPEPINVFHGTPGDPFARFDLAKSQDFGIHAGTRGQAEMFARAPGDLFGVKPTGHIFDMMLGPKGRPFTSMEVKDHNIWTPMDVAADLASKGVRFTPQEMKRIQNGQWYNGNDHVDAAYRAVTDALNRSGVDALRYNNTHEIRAGDPDRTSWITWKPETLYDRASGRQLFGGAASAAPAAASILEQAYYGDKNQQ